jgi:hypothetical protein
LKTKQEVKDAMGKGVRFVFGGSIMNETDLDRYSDEAWVEVSKRIMTVQEYHDAHARPSVNQGGGNQ